MRVSGQSTPTWQEHGPWNPTVYLLSPLSFLPLSLLLRLDIQEALPLLKDIIFFSVILVRK